MKRYVALTIPILVTLFYLFPPVVMGLDRASMVLASLEESAGLIHPDRLLIIVSKKERRLYLFKGKSLVKSYKVALGKRPWGDKEYRGDKRTPVGKFFICTKNPKSRFYLSLGISYPSIEDAKRGLAQGLISKREYNEIVWAIRSGRRPPWNTALGGAICIHGGGAWPDWTDGCIALYNKDIRDLYKRIPIGTPVIIVE